MPSDLSYQPMPPDEEPIGPHVKNWGQLPPGQDRPNAWSSTRDCVNGAADFLSGGGEMGLLMRAKAWGETPLGQPDAWPQSLRTVIRILLTSRYQMWMGWGPDLSFFYNDAYRPTLGVKHPTALGASAREVWKEIWPDIGPRIEHVLGTGEATWDEALLLFLERSGYPEETYHTFSYSPLADDAGAIVGMLCVVTEETERVIGERRLSSLRELASEIAGNNTSGEVLAAAERALGANLKDLPFTLTYLFDQDGIARLAGATGVSSGHPIAPTVIDPMDPNAVWPARAIRERHTTRLQSDLDTRFGEIPTGDWDKPARQAVIVPIARQGQDVPAGFMVAGVNPYRRPDETWFGFIDLVAGQIASGLANAHAYEEERRRAEALAEINRAKITFFSNVSHEFRTPLTLMLGPLEDVLAAGDGLLPPDHHALVRVAHRNGVRLLKLVNTLLDFSRIEAGRAQASFVPVELASFTADLASNFQSATEKAGIRLVVDRSPLPRPVHVDRDMWEKVILNLLSNAFKFTFEGEIAVETRTSSDGGHAEATVRDTGIGIAADELPHLFERFRRVENARGRSIEGSGIGLALVQELVRLHGGTVRVDSVVGRGSSFTVSVPFGDKHLPPEQIGRASLSASLNVRANAYVDEALGWLSEEPTDAGMSPVAAMDDVADVAATARGEDRLILLADDNADMRTYLRRLLQAAGYRVEAVTDGELALTAAKKLRPHLVLSDVMMPRLDGFGLLAELRSDPELRDTPVLLLSARAGEEAKIEGLSAGADDYLIKPFSARELLARVRTNLDMADLRREAVRTENELRREAQIARDRAEGILASINDGFFTIGRNWHFTYINAAAERMLNRAADELLGHDFWAAYPANVGTQIETHFRCAMADRVSVAFENHYVPWQRWYDVRVYPARDGGLSIYFQDITDRKLAEDALRRLNETLELQIAERTAELRHKEARLRSVFETSYTFQGLMSVDGTLLDANATSLGAINARIGDVIGKPFWDTPWFTGTPGMPDLVRSAVPSIAGGETLRQEIHVNLPVGGWRWFDFQMRPVRDGQGQVVAIVPEAVETTLRRQAEETMRQAQKMDGIGQITGGVAHDFNNLLTIIVGNLELLGRQLKSPARDIAAMDRSADNAMRGAQRAASLTQRLLAFSRQQPLDPRPVDVARLVTGMSDLLRGTIGEQISIETVLAGGIGHANIDANQLEIAILNLAVNARDAMPNGGKLTIETSGVLFDAADVPAELAAGHYIVLAVTDSGTGMAPETLSKAFEPFFTTKDVGHGTGLGLSQVYGFVRQSGGQVKIQSEIGQGTSVRMYLPRFQSTAIPVPEEPAANAARGRNGECILVVEDDEDVRSYTTEVLRDLGYRVVEAANGAVALELLEQHSEIRLLFTDVGLPGGMNGRQLAEAARQRRPMLKILFTTGYARDAIIHDGRLDPGVVLITKPFTYPALAEKLRETLDSASAERRILLVEDEVLIQMIIADGLEELGFKVDAAGSASEAKTRLHELTGAVDAAVIDMGLPDAKGDELVRDLRANYPALPIVIASGQDKASMRQLFSGRTSMAFLSKPYTIENLCGALRDVGVLI
jgi:signal transduction histidine kinase/DNA-binding response OmpR family regulator